MKCEGYQINISKTSPTFLICSFIDIPLPSFEISCATFCKIPEVESDRDPIMTLFGIFMSFHTWSPLHSLARAWPKWMRISETRFKMTKWVHIISGTIMKFRIVWDTVNPSLNYWELSLNCSERLPHNLSSQLWHKMTSFCPRPQVCTPWTVFVLRN